MEKKMYKLPFVNKGEEFELPEIQKGGIYMKMLEIRAETENKYKNLIPVININNIRQQLLNEIKQLYKKEGTLLTEYIQTINRIVKDNNTSYDNLMSSRDNFEMTYYILNKIDSNVTKKDVEDMDYKDIAKFILALYRIEDMDFRKAEKKKKQNPPKNN